MTVKELMEWLQGAAPEAQVLFQGKPIRVKSMLYGEAVVLDLEEKPGA